MITIRPFFALRPKEEYAKECAALPYDVMSSDEARTETKNKPYSFLHVDKAEIDLPPTVDLYDDLVYKKAAGNLFLLEREGIYIQDKERQYYFYRQIMNGRAQTGVVGCVSIDDYLENRVKKHELTRADKEADRIRHVDECSAQTGPIFLTYRESESLNKLIHDQTQKPPLYDFVSEDGVRHTVWESDGERVNEQITAAFKDVPSLYIADGHHRAASAVKAGLKRRNEKAHYSGEEEFNYFLSIIFPSEQLKIMDYNRLMYGLNGLTEAEFLKKVEETLGRVLPVESAYRPTKPHTVGLYVGEKWYCVEFRKEICDGKTAVERLDCSILQNCLLAPVLGIEDPRTDKKIDFVGGIRGIGYLVERCRLGASAAIVMYPTSMEELMEIADGGEIMPPKSTWFEPKLRSGIFIHKI